MKIVTGKLVMTLALLLVLLVTSLPACGGGASSPPITVLLSFPDGAPPLNQEAELVCTVNTPAMSVKNLGVSVDLPEALELVSGDLSWVGDVAEGDEVEIIRAVVRSVKTGNWTIELNRYLDPEEHGWFGFQNPDPFYISIFEDSAEWGVTPPWYEGGSHEVPIEVVEAPSTPIKVDLSISHAPAVNTVAKLTCTVSSTEDAPNTTAQVKLPKGASLVSGSLNWQGNLKANEPVTFSAEIMFREAGKGAVEATASCEISRKNSWGDIDIIYLTFEDTRGEFGWPRTGPVKITQTKEGEVPGVLSSQDEPPVEELPPPPALLMSRHHSPGFHVLYHRGTRPR